MRLLLAPLACLALLAGCLEPNVPSAGEIAADTEVALATGMSYVCPPGPNTTRNGVCIGRIVGRTQSDVEPYLAIHPTDPKVMAIGTNARHTVDSVAREGNEVQARQGQMNFYFTEDGGASWRRAPLPYVSVPGMNPAPVQVGFAGDPALEFDADGTLHVSALVISPIRGTSTGSGGTIDVIYTSTKDLGRTWSKAVVFTRDGRNDRNWITLGPSDDIYVPWQKPGLTSDVAWSLDGGATWRQLTADQRPKACVTVSLVVVHEGTPVFACAGTSDGRASGIRIQALDVATGQLTQRANLTDLPCVWPQLEPLKDGSIVLIAESCREGTGIAPGLRLSRSLDGGLTWSTPVKLTPLTKANVDITMWMRADPWGGLHVLATRNYGDLEHVLLDPADFSVVWSQVIRPAEAPSVPPKVPEGFPAISGGDHYYGLVFTKDGGYAAWARDYGVDFARLKPVWAEPGESKA